MNKPNEPSKATPLIEQIAIIRRGEGMKRVLGLYLGKDKRPLLREGQNVSERDLESIQAAIEKALAPYTEVISHEEMDRIEREHPPAAQPQPQLVEQIADELLDELYEPLPCSKRRARPRILSAIEKAIRAHDYELACTAARRTAEARAAAQPQRSEAFSVCACGHAVIDHRRCSDHDECTIGECECDAIRPASGAASGEIEFIDEIDDRRSEIQTGKRILEGATSSDSPKEERGETHAWRDEILHSWIREQPTRDERAEFTAWKLWVELRHRHNAALTAERADYDKLHDKAVHWQDEALAEREVRKPLVDELQNIVNCDLDGMRKDFGEDTDRQFRMWAQNRARAALALAPASPSYGGQAKETKRPAD